MAAICSRKRKCPFRISSFRGKTRAGHRIITCARAAGLHYAPREGLFVGHKESIDRVPSMSYTSFSEKYWENYNSYRRQSWSYYFVDCNVLLCLATRKNIIILTNGPLED